MNQAKSGTLYDSQITDSDVIPFDAPGIFDVYFTFIGTQTEMGAMNRLVNSIIDQIQELALNGFFIREIVANAITEDGIKICERFGMSRVCPHKDYGHVYASNFSPWPESLRGHRWNSIRKMYEDNSA